MRGKFEKSVCKCPRCVAKRRIRFFAWSGVCIALGAGCYILVSHSVTSGPATSLNAPETAAAWPPEASGIPHGNQKSMSRALARLETSRKQADTKSEPESLLGDGSPEGSLDLTKSLTPPGSRRSRAAFPPSSSFGESKIPHTKAWYTVLLADPSRNVRDVVQGTSTLDSAKVAVTPAEPPARPTFAKPAVPPVVGTSLLDEVGKVKLASSSDSYELLPRWLTAGSQMPESGALKADSDRVRSVAPVERPQSLSGAVSSGTNNGAEKPADARTTESPQPTRTEPAAVGTAAGEPESTPEAMTGVKPPEPNEILPPPPEETGMAARSQPDEAHSIVEESSHKPRGYLTIESETRATRNPEAEDPRPKRRDHPPSGQDHSLKAQEHSLAVQGHPLKVPDHPSSEPEEKSADLRRFASAFLEADQTGNISDQHRFYADSVHFYREGDLSWTGVEAATRRYHQQRQNIRFGTEGTAAVKGPVDGGFYVVEQPLSWSRAEGSRLTRGRSVLRLRVVPTNRGDWKITSIEEIGQ